MSCKSSLSLEEPGTYVMEHPMHFHGLTVQVVDQGFPITNQTTGTAIYGTPEIHCPRETCSSGANWTEAHTGHEDVIGAYGPKKDTIVVPPSGYVVVRFRADNPGMYDMFARTKDQ